MPKRNPPVIFIQVLYGISQYGVNSNLVREFDAVLKCHCMVRKTDNLIVETGTVLEVLEGKALVKVTGPSQCSSCSSEKGCPAKGQRAFFVDLAPDLKIREGQKVKIALPLSSGLKASVAVYLVPVVAVMAGAVGGHVLSLYYGSAGSMPSVIGAGMGVALSAFILVLLDKALRSRPAYHPRIIALIEESAPHPFDSR